MEVLSSKGLTKSMPTCAWGIFSDMFLFKTKKSFHPLGISDRQHRVHEEGILGALELLLN